MMAYNNLCTFTCRAEDGNWIVDLQMIKWVKRGIKYLKDYGLVCSPFHLKQSDNKQVAAIIKWSCPKTLHSFIEVYNRGKNTFTVEFTSMMSFIIWATAPLFACFLRNKSYWFQCKLLPSKATILCVLTQQWVPLNSVELPSKQAWKESGPKCQYYTRLLRSKALWVQ